MFVFPLAPAEMGLRVGIADMAIPLTTDKASRSVWCP